MRHRNQSNKGKVALYKPIICFDSHLKQVIISNKRITSVLKVGVAYVGELVCASMCLKESWFGVQITSFGLLVSYTTKELKILYALLCGP